MNTKLTPNHYIRSQIAHSPIITFSEDQLKPKDINTLEKIYCYQIQSLRALVGEQIFNILHNVYLIDSLVKEHNK